LFLEELRLFAPDMKFDLSEIQSAMPFYALSR